MARQTMLVKLTNNTQPQAEAVVLKNDNSWQSPPGGWLPVQNGLWDQLPDGVHLKNSVGNEKVAVLQALNFFTSSVGNSGTALYPSIAGVGNWRVEDVNDD